SGETQELVCTRPAQRSPWAKLAVRFEYHYRASFGQSLESGWPRDGQTATSDREHGQPGGESSRHAKRIPATRRRPHIGAAGALVDPAVLLPEPAVPLCVAEFARRVRVTFSDSRSTSCERPTGGAILPRGTAPAPAAPGLGALLFAGGFDIKLTSPSTP